MAGYPIAWEEGFSDRTVPTDQCPYTREEIEKYLDECHFHLSTDLPVVHYKVGEVVASRTEVGRRFWLLQARDELERDWFVVVGSGQGPFDPRKKMWRWMYAETNELSQSPEDYLEIAIDEQVANDVRSN